MLGILFIFNEENMTLPYRGVIGIAVLKPPEKIYESLSGGVKLQTQIYYTGTPSQTIS